MAGHSTTVQALVALDGLIYAGNHGLEIGGPGLSHVEPSALQLREPLARMARELTAQLQGVAGLIVENKGLTLSIHVRQVAPSEMISVVNTVENVAAQNAEAFRLTYGKKVLEIRPKTNWNKGSAALDAQANRFRGIGSIFFRRRPDR